jgi:hypothetical protein
MWQQVSCINKDELRLSTQSLANAEKGSGVVGDGAGVRKKKKTGRSSKGKATVRS